MILTEEQRTELEAIVKPVMEYLSNPKIFHPHIKIIIDLSSAELVEGLASIRTDEFIKD